MIIPRGRAGWLSGQPYLLLFMAAFGWAANAIVARLSIGQVSPMALVCLRWLVVVVILAVVARREIAAAWPVLKGRWAYLSAMGALGYTVFNALFYLSGHHTSAVNIGVTQAVTPALVMAGSLAAYGTPIRPTAVLGLLTTLLGVIVIVGQGDLAVIRSFAFNIGDLGIMTSCILYAGYTVALRRRPAVPPLAFFAAMAVAAFLTSLPLLAFEVAAGTVIWPGAFGWGLVAFVAVVPSFLSQLFYMRGVELIGPSPAGLVMNLVPVIVAGLAVAILGERFAPYHAVALALVLGGIWLAGGVQEPAPARPPAGPRP